LKSIYHKTILLCGGEAAYSNITPRNRHTRICERIEDGSDERDLQYHGGDPSTTPKALALAEKFITTPMAHTNSWSNPSKAGAGDAVQMASFLEERSHTPDTLEVNQKLCECIDPQPGERLLEVGSGSGILCRMLAPQLQPGGCMLGVDISPEMAAEARKYTLIEGSNRGIAFQTSTAELLPFPNASLDGAIAARLLLHVANPEAVICEMKRVVKPGGRVIVMDWDFDTVAVDHPDRELTRRLLQWRSDHHGGNNWSGRQLWRCMYNAGLHDLSVHPWVTVAHFETDGLTQSLWRAAEVACVGGAISPTEQEAWTKELKNRIQAGTFFASIVYFIVKAMVVSG
jgi:ubiquinone/menaquinone biosynthesis C-methylase UbiE